MKKEDGRSLTRSALEERHKTIIRMKDDGKTNTEISEATGASLSGVTHFVRQWKEQGANSIPVLKRGNKPGQRRKFSPEQEQNIKNKIVDQTPDTLGLDHALWTRRAVQDLIKKEYNFIMPIRTVGEYLKRWDFTPQKPKKVAYERKEERVKEWFSKEYPEIKKSAKSDGAVIYWGDEAGLSASDIRGRSFAPKGKTPVVKAKAAYVKLSMVSAITNQGKVSWMFFDSSVNAEKFIEFLGHLLREVPGSVYLIVDNLQVHHSAIVTDWVAKQNGRLKLFFLPPYSPDLNPDEHLNSDMKYGVGSKPASKSKERLQKTAEDHMNKIAKIPERIKRYFEDPAISYAV